MNGLLKDLPSRGHFVSPTPGAVICKQPTSYVAAHSTAPPENQIVTSDPTNILIRSLINNKNKETEARKKQGKEKAGKKRAADGPAGPSAPKRQNSGATPVSQGGPTACYSPQQLRGKSNQELTDVLKTMHQPVRGRKDELVKRIIDVQGSGSK